MWRAPAGDAEYLVNVIWPFTPFTATNGATEVWPHSHGRNATLDAPEGNPIAAEMAPGAALMFLGSTLHGAGANKSAEVRSGCVVGYALGRAVAALNARLHAARMVEVELLDDAAAELAALAAVVDQGDRRAAERGIVAYHRRRRRAAADVVRRLYRTSQVGPATIAI